MAHGHKAVKRRKAKKTTITTTREKHYITIASLAAAAPGPLIIFSRHITLQFVLHRSTQERDSGHECSSSVSYEAIVAIISYLD